MKKLFIGLLIISAVILSSCENQAQETTTKVWELPNPNIWESCENQNGKWLQEHNECETGNKQWCSENGWSFNGCDSPCRHDENAEFCIEMCVSTCWFESK